MSIIKRRRVIIQLTVRNLKDQNRITTLKFVASTPRIQALGQMELLWGEVGWELGDPDFTPPRCQDVYNLLTTLQVFILGI